MAIKWASQAKEVGAKSLHKDTNNGLQLYHQSLEDSETYSCKLVIIYIYVTYYVYIYVYYVYIYISRYIRIVDPFRVPS